MPYLNLPDGVEEISWVAAGYRIRAGRGGVQIEAAATFGPTYIRPGGAQKTAALLADVSRLQQELWPPTGEPPTEEPF